jgi:hypothetical protein
MCATIAMLRPVCPEALPRGPGSTTVYTETAPGRPRVFSVEAGGQYYGGPAHNRPPRYFHLAVSARRLAPSDEAAWLRPRLPRLRPGDAVRADTGRPELVGRRVWFGTPGALVLTPTRDLAFRWHSGAVGYEMGLHVWAPFRETAPTLRVLLGRTLPGSPPHPSPPSPAPPSDGLRWIETPAWVSDACASLPRLDGVCPRVIPLARSGFVTASLLRNDAMCGTRGDLMSVQWSGEDPSHPRRDRPPRFLHLEVTGGSGCARWHFARAAVTPRDGMMRRRTYAGSGPVPLGRRTWGGHRGLLVLGDCYGNHVCFRWRAAAVGYQIDLHGWEPFPQAVAALRRIVSSTG